MLKGAEKTTFQDVLEMDKNIILDSWFKIHNHLHSVNFKCLLQQLDYCPCFTNLKSKPGSNVELFMCRI